MQQRGCEKIQLLLSKYADNEATPSERERVRSHVATCEACAGRLAEYEEVSAMFSSEPRRAAEPQLRAGLFQQIHRLKEEEQRRQRRAEESRPWYLPARPLHVRGSRSALARAWELFSPFAAAAVAVFALLAVTAIFRGPNSPVIQSRLLPSLPPVPTLAPPLVVPSSYLPTEAPGDATAPGPPAPAATSKIVDATFSPTSLVANIPTAVGGHEEVLRLARPRPVMEEGDIANPATWHVVGDPAYGYSIAYPPNWWTQAAGQARYFFPWQTGGISFPPYWLDLRVERNTGSFTAHTYNRLPLGGKGTVEPVRGSGPARLRYASSDRRNGYDEIYYFDSRYIYVLRASVPVDNPVDGFEQRWRDAEGVLSRMSGRLGLPLEGPPALGYAPVLFLNGSDLWMLDPSNQQPRAITHDDAFPVRQFALSPDMKAAAFTEAKSDRDLWGRMLYLVRLDDLGNPDAGPIPLWSDLADIHDIAWYADRELVAIAQGPDGLGVYTIAVPPASEGRHPSVRVARIALLSDDMTSARGLSVSPDRQLITFLAPILESGKTDVYALRPDGSDLTMMLSHADPLLALPGGGRILTPDTQAVKSYVWTSGHLEQDGYRFHMLFTCGKADSPTLYRGGFLFSSAGMARGPLLNQHRLLNQQGSVVTDALKMQIVHMAYSPGGGKLALTGYHNDVEGRAELLDGLWTADIVDGALTNLRALRIPDRPHGITDLQWSPDGQSLIYRETMPRNASAWSDRYDGSSPFQLVKLDHRTQWKDVLYSSE